jgi:membrane associated rhomboid family serine protease
LWAVHTLIGAILAVFAYQVALGPEVALLVGRHGVVPARVCAALAGGDLLGALRAVGSVASAAFLHGGYVHVLGNVLYLRVFGERVEAKLGAARFLGLYAGAAAVGAAAEVASAPGSWTPVVGASGAIAGILGAYVVLFPTARITTLFPALVTLTFVELPAVLFVGLWATQQALNGYLRLAEGIGAHDVAWLAHLGGFAVGLLAGLVHRAGGAPPPTRARGP